jgi:hypothetical protein
MRISKAQEQHQSKFVFDLSELERRRQTDESSVDYLYRLHYSRSMKKYKNEENERTISVTKKGHCACLHHGPINIPTLVVSSLVPPFPSLWHWLAVTLVAVAVATLVLSW